MSVLSSGFCVLFALPGFFSSYVIWRNVNHRSRVHARPVILWLSAIACNILMSSFAVLWLRRDDLKALELMTEIMQRLKERELKQAKEMVFI